MILEANILDQASFALANAVATKMIGQLSDIVGKLSSFVDFIVANDTSYAEATVAIGSAAKNLNYINKALSSVATKLLSLTLTQTQPPIT